jgi:hypothetical protein
VVAEPARAEPLQVRGWQVSSWIGEPTFDGTRPIAEPTRTAWRQDATSPASVRELPLALTAKPTVETIR